VLPAAPLMRVVIWLQRMPNCDFYAAGPDLDELLEFVFALPDCRVFESYSLMEQELVEFQSTAEIRSRYRLGHCGGTGDTVLLQLVPSRAGGAVGVARIELDPRRCQGATFRYRLTGWGLIQLYLGGVSPRGVVHSHTNHASEKWARAWEATCAWERGPVSAWDWREVTRVSSKINRFIRQRLAVGRIASRPVLRHANELLVAGVAAI
jgi:hypothetical protein